MCVIICMCVFAVLYIYIFFFSTNTCSFSKLLKKKMKIYNHIMTNLKQLGDLLFMSSFPLKYKNLLLYKCKALV